MCQAVFFFFSVAQVLQEINEEVRRNHGYTPSEVEALTQTFRALGPWGWTVKGIGWLVKIW